MSNVSYGRIRPSVHLIAAAALLATVIGIPCYYYHAGNVTLAEIEQIQNGMTKDQVRQIIGRPKSRYVDGGKDHWQYTWHSGPSFNGGFVIRFDNQERVEVVLQ